MSDLTAPAAAAGAAVPRSETMTGTVQVPFPEFIQPPEEPLGLLAAWLADAAERGVREPRALALATADAQGRTSSRTVALSEVSGDGIVFLTHAGSRKGRELAQNPWASGVLYWRETSRQVTFAGPVSPLPAARSQELWCARAPFTHAMSTASRQSEPLDGLEDVARLRARARELGTPLRPLPRPDTFVGYRLEPVTVEFWGQGSDRLHERLLYQRTRGAWRVGRLQP
ncbi:phenazine biosynthesis FMN-dependent oxidase PhzG [Streptomyces sp. NPDC059063]|uniref:phenazine biosynthesis FMN-dependent oxidase PhzG n=1 Tax=unclassified Streptomyces TaxID=2593676 RepID=UPI0036844AF5